MDWFVELRVESEMAARKKIISLPGAFSMKRIKDILMSTNFVCDVAKQVSFDKNVHHKQVFLLMTCGVEQIIEFI